jgi:hypothetical protein
MREVWLAMALTTQPPGMQSVVMLMKQACGGESLASM